MLTDEQAYWLRHCVERWEAPDDYVWFDETDGQIIMELYALGFCGFDVAVCSKPDNKTGVQKARRALAEHEEGKR